MFHKLDELLQRHDELTSMLGDPSITQDPQQLRQIMREHARLQEIVDAYRRFKAVCQQLDDNVELLSVDDPELRQLVREEQQQLQLEREALEADIQRLLIPPDPRDARDVFLEVRAGTGGEEAALFAASLFRMYSRYAATQGWRMEIISASESERGGLREIIARVSGDGVFSRLKFESGTHRVQRIPETESQGRIHTSAVTVAILPEVDEVEVQIDESDLRIDVYRSSGAGGQHVNTTDSAVRITHLPTKVVTQCQSERSQHQNKATAMKMLRALLADHLLQTQRDSVAADRRQQVGSGDRSERIRTYNFPQSRITDHRINFTTHRLAQVLEGQVEEVIDPLRAHFQAEALKEAST